MSRLLTVARAALPCIVTCVKCDRSVRIPGTMDRPTHPPVWYDPQGVAFQAYYCDACGTTLNRMDAANAQRALRPDSTPEQARENVEDRPSFQGYAFYSADMFASPQFADCGKCPIIDGVVDVVFGCATHHRPELERDVFGRSKR